MELLERTGGAAWVRACMHSGTQLVPVTDKLQSTLFAGTSCCCCVWRWRRERRDLVVMLTM